MKLRILLYVFAIFALAIVDTLFRIKSINLKERITTAIYFAKGLLRVAKFGVFEPLQKQQKGTMK